MHKHFNINLKIVQQYEKLQTINIHIFYLFNNGMENPFSLYVNIVMNIIVKFNYHLFTNINIYFIKMFINKLTQIVVTYIHSFINRPK